MKNLESHHRIWRIADLDIRPAVKADADDLARLIDAAGEGIPRWLWSRSAEPGQTPMDVGRERAAREVGGFSYRNAWVVEADDQVAAMLLGYPLDDPYEIDDLEELPVPVRPLILLESQAPGSWYVNAIAVREPWRRQGIASRLMAFAEERGRQAGAQAMSGIVAEENQASVGLCRRSGYVVEARRPVVAFEDFPYAGDWLLFRKPLG